VVTMLKMKTFGFQADGEGKDNGEVKNECKGRFPRF